MIKEHWIKLVGGLIVLLIAAGMLWMIDDGAIQEESSSEPKRASESLPQLNNPTTALSQQASKPSSSSTSSSEKGSIATLPSTPPQQVLEHIARQFGASLRFPPYSIPLKPTDHALLHPYYFNVVKRTFLESDAYTYFIELPRFILFRPKPIPVRFTIQSTSGEGLPQIHWVRGAILSAGQPVAEFTLEATTESEQQQLFFFELQPKAEEVKSWRRELMVQVSFLMSGFEEQHFTTPFRYEPSVATLQGAQESYVEGAHLVIPLEWQLEREGYFKVQANLFDAQSQQPVTHLNHKQELRAPKDVLFLKAHIATLKHQQSPGPYELRDITIERLPDSFKESRLYGQGDSARFSISKHDFKKYQHTEWAHPLEQKKLKRFKEQFDFNE